jgi:hypothetical protein
MTDLHRRWRALALTISGSTTVLLLILVLILPEAGMPTAAAPPGPALTPTLASSPQPEAHFPLVQKAQSTPQPTSTPLPDSLQILNSRLYLDGSRAVVVGEVYNAMDHPVYYVQIMATFYDNSGTVGRYADAFTDLPKTAPGQHNPFMVVLNHAPPGIVRYSLQLTLGSNPIADYQPATILSAAVRDNGGAEVVGELRNDQAKPLDVIRVVVAFYDPDGTVYDVATEFLSGNPLAPGASVSYHVSTFKDELLGLPYVVQAQGELAP